MRFEAHHTQQKALSTLDLPFSVLQNRINSTYIQFFPLCGTVVNFFDSYNLILSEYFLLTSPWIVLVICSSKLQFQGYYAYQWCCEHYISWAKNIRYWRVQNNVGSHLRRKLCAVKPTILSKKRLVLSICLSRFSNTQSILLTSNFSPVCGTLVNFFDSYNLIISENLLLTSPWFVLRMLLNELWSTCLYSHYR